MNMGSYIARAVVVSAVFMLAYMILAPFGLGWVAFLAFILYVGASLYRAYRHAPVGEDGERPQEAQEGTSWPLKRARGQNGKVSAEDRQRQAQERARREADCGLTHEERVRFHDIIQGLNDDRA